MMLQTPSKAILVNEPNVYSYWQLGAIQIELTTLLRITEGSAKQLMISLLFTEICMIGYYLERGMYFMFRLRIPRNY